MEDNNDDDEDNHTVVRTDGYLFLREVNSY